MGRGIDLKMPEIFPAKHEDGHKASVYEQNVQIISNMIVYLGIRVK